MENNTLEIKPKIEASWLEVLEQEFRQPYFQALKSFLVEEKKHHIVYPPGPLMFNAFNQTPFNRVKVVLLGQDPYHGHGQAEGMSFSVPRGVKPPPSLINIYKELYDDLGCNIPSHGSLQHWAGEGVLMLNTVLTVRASQPGSHKGKGWEEFTGCVIRTLSEKRDHLVFFLWGKFAHEKEGLIDTEKHLVLKAAHPSPYSASAGFFGCRHFSKANKFLEMHGMGGLNWEIPGS